MNLVLAEEVLSHIHNWFVRDSMKLTGAVFTEDGPPVEVESYVPSGGFYRVQGTFLNDGLHKFDEPTDVFQPDEAASVTISRLAIPTALVVMFDEIEDWEDKYGDVAKGPFFSESFGGYEYEIRGYSSYGAASSSMSGWRLAFANRLNPWRRMRD